jgi:hypothetical protein
MNIGLCPVAIQVPNGNEVLKRPERATPTRMVEWLTLADRKMTSPCIGCHVLSRPAWKRSIPVTTPMRLGGLAMRGYRALGVARSPTAMPLATTRKAAISRAIRLTSGLLQNVTHWPRAGRLTSVQPWVSAMMSIEPHRSTI